MSSDIIYGDDSRSLVCWRLDFLTLAKPKQIILKESVARFVASDHGDSFRLRVDLCFRTCGDEEARLGSKAEVKSKVWRSASRSASHGCGAPAYATWRVALLGPGGPRASQADVEHGRLPGRSPRALERVVQDGNALKVTGDQPRVRFCETVAEMRSSTPLLIFPCSALEIVLQLHLFRGACGRQRNRLLVVSTVRGERCTKGNTKACLTARFHLPKAATRRLIAITCTTIAAFTRNASTV